MQHNSALDKPNTYPSTLTPTLILFFHLCLGLLRHLLHSKKCPALVALTDISHVITNIQIDEDMTRKECVTVIEMEQDLKSNVNEYDKPPFSHMFECDLQC